MGERATCENVVQPDFIQRKSLCFARPDSGLVLHGGDDGFREDVAKLLSVHENNAAEQVIDLKDQLRTAKVDDFWILLTEGLASITGAQYAFVSKRVLVDEENAAIEMPPLGETGACLMATAMYCNDGAGYKQHFPKNFKYHAYGCPCAYMRHDKVFIIPERLNEFITDNPNQLPIPGEAYIGIPLFAEGKCFAHFGVMWSPEGAARRTLGWGYLEMLLHSFEDMILQRVLEGKSFKKPELPQRKASQVIPHGAITAVQSLKPYARSLSHELRTPMQGVVGMLDVMYATVQEAAECQTNPQVQQVFQALKQNIEVVQDSSRRAVEAADNVVHAYDLNMTVPEAASAALEEEVSAEPAKPDPVRQGTLMSDDETKIAHGTKRRRDADTPWRLGNQNKRRAYESAVGQRSPRREVLERAVSDCGRIMAGGALAKSTDTAAQASGHFRPPTLSACSSTEDENATSSGLRHSSLRDVIRNVINESLLVGGRPESTTAQDSAWGEVIEVRTRTSSGIVHEKTIEWIADVSVPDTILIDERELAKLISCVFLNAVKFTEEGKITVTAKLSRTGRYVVINVKDTGPGIPAAFLPNLFKPFSREDDSLTRQQEGLGLGLLVAKGLSRKLGGDLNCIRADTSGPNRGSEFEMRVPIAPSEASRPSSPFASPKLSARTRLNTEAEGEGSLPPARRSWNLAEESIECNDHVHPPRSPQPRSNTSQPGPLTEQRDKLLTPVVHPATLMASVTSAPRRQSTATSPAPSLKTSFNRNLATKYPLTFLVAEDNKINRALLVNMLHKLGYPANSVYEAHDGADAVKQVSNIKAAGRSVDVVLMDLWMPFMDGYEAAERILDMHRSSREEGSDYFDAHAATVNRNTDISDNGNDNERRRPSVESVPALTTCSTGSIPSSVQTTPNDALTVANGKGTTTASGGGPGARSKKLRKAPKILAVTADVTEDALRRAAKVGMTGYMTKPYKIVDLERLIEEFCAGSASEKELVS